MTDVTWAISARVVMPVGLKCEYIFRIFCNAVRYILKRGADIIPEGHGVVVTIVKRQPCVWQSAFAQPIKNSGGFAIAGRCGYQCQFTILRTLQLRHKPVPADNISADIWSMKLGFEQFASSFPVAWIIIPVYL